MNTETDLETVARLGSEASRLGIQGDYAGAELLYLRALAMLENVFGPDHPNVAKAHYCLVGVLEKQGNLAAAAESYERAFAIMKKRYGPDYQSQLFSWLHDFARRQSSRGDYVAAEGSYRRMLATLKNKPDDRNDMALAATCLHSLAVMVEKQGKCAAAEELYRQAVAAFEKAGSYHHFLAGCLGDLAKLLRKQGLHAQAEPIYQRSLAALEESKWRGHVHEP